MEPLAYCRSITIINWKCWLPVQWVPANGFKIIFRYYIIGMFHFFIPPLPALFLRNRQKFSTQPRLLSRTFLQHIQLPDLQRRIRPNRWRRMWMEGSNYRWTAFQAYIKASFASSKEHLLLSITFQMCNWTLFVSIRSRRLASIRTGNQRKPVKRRRTPQKMFRKENRKWRR